MWLERRSVTVLRRACLAVLVAFTLAGCDPTGLPPSASLAGARGATVTFESIDGAPREVFDRLVRELNVEAQARNLAVVARTEQSAYRVRGYIVAERSGNAESINWIWDVYDDHQQRVLRISGAQAVANQAPDIWLSLDGASVQKIAHESVAQLAAFLTSPDAIPAARADVALSDGTSPEAAGIFRLTPVSAAMPDAAQALTPEPQIDPAPAEADVPLPPHRPGLGRTAARAVLTASND